ncbi:hypothetical protein M422DRAFT_261435 [Sphaerobolus stellatus SS14]|uniref:Unplaced genomic scaffold SPHSTscaffold_105, whole genome shotgun sequence n=1 Tax=Sphaerobolus stellatus (strain SS14) TaxID=990650 RepID=A0A0C9U0K8_SPHS4|nr:hypothetical protein M422DRAFT_261435 [Sphaerobolus stellatus SS14]
MRVGGNFKGSTLPVHAMITKAMGIRAALIILNFVNFIPPNVLTDAHKDILKYVIILLSSITFRFTVLVTDLLGLSTRLCSILLHLYPAQNDSDDAGFDFYSIPDALNPEAPQDDLLFMNDPKTRAALHAPTSKDLTSSLPYPFGNDPDGVDPSIEFTSLRVRREPFEAASLQI